jgi:hypothetical protein
VTTVSLLQLDAPLGEFLTFQIALDHVMVLREDVDRQRTVVRTFCAHFILPEITRWTRNATRTIVSLNIRSFAEMRALVFTLTMSLAIRDIERPAVSPTHRLEHRLHSRKRA